MVGVSGFEPPTAWSETIFIGKVESGHLLSGEDSKAGGANNLS